jgi:hypothetical protein
MTTTTRWRGRRSPGRAQKFGCGWLAGAAALAVAVTALLSWAKMGVVAAVDGEPAVGGEPAVASAANAARRVVLVLVLVLVLVPPLRQLRLSTTQALGPRRRMRGWLPS